MSPWLERHWLSVTPVSAALFPVSLLFGLIAAVRRAAYARGFMRSHRLPVPVIVVGNIMIGGTGKTPLVVWLANYLARHSLRPGIVSRGYGASSREPRAVGANSDPAQCGDEPVLLARRSGCPVWIGADRVAAAQRLLQAHPECSVVVSDDGLQHYRLARDFEIAVLDGERGLGNGLLLPAGPLREPAARLREVDAVVIQGRTGLAHTPSYAMTLEGRQFQNLPNPEHVVDAQYFNRRRVRAIAGIGNPQRFFAHLRSLGLSFEARTFPDHHAYTASDFSEDGADAIVMTEKDAVKCAGFASEKFWALPVDANPDPDLGPLILRKLKP